MTPPTRTARPTSPNNPPKPKLKTAKDHGGRSRRWWTTAAVTCAVAVALLAVVFATRPRDTAPAAGTTGAAGGVDVGGVPAVREVTAVSGDRLRIPAASKPTALFFSAAWCQTCVPEAQAWDRIERSIGDRISIVVIDADPSDTPQRLQGFIDLVGDPRYPFVIDTDATLARTYEMGSLDTTVIMDADGQIVFRDAVPTSEATLRSELAELGLS